MAKIEVNGVSIAYEVAGEGPPIVWTGGGWFPRNPFTFVFAGRFSANYKVLTWDRRNCGASDMAIEDAPSDWHLWTDDLHALLQKLDMRPAYVGGGSAGSELSLLMAHRYPEDVRALILHDPSTNNVQDVLQPMAEARYFCLARVAETEGMEAAIKLSTDPPESAWAWLTSWVAESIAENPENRGRLLSMEPEQFSEVMKKWGRWLASPRLHLSNLSDEEIRNISKPAIVAHGFDPGHPEHVGRELHNLLPNAEWVEYSNRLTSEEIQRIVDMHADADVGWSSELAFRFPFYEDFLHRVESGRFEGGS